MPATPQPTLALIAQHTVRARCSKADSRLCWLEAKRACRLSSPTLQMARPALSLAQLLGWTGVPRPGLPLLMQQASDPVQQGAETVRHQRATQASRAPRPAADRWL